MSRARKPGAAYQTAEWKARVSAGLRRRNAVVRELLEVSPPDLRLLRKGTAIPARLKPYADVAADTMRRLRRAAEGEPGTRSYKALSEQRIVLLENAQRILLLGMCEMARSLMEGDGEAASRAGTLLARFGTMVRDTVGLDPREHELTLQDYLQEKAQETASAASHEANGSKSDAEVVDVGNSRESALNVQTTEGAGE